MYCLRCQDMAKDGKFCRDCGGLLMQSKVKCPHTPCRGMNFRNSKFCEDCGKPIQEDSKSSLKGGGE